MGLFFRKKKESEKLSRKEESDQKVEKVESDERTSLQEKQNKKEEPVKEEVSEKKSTEKTKKPVYRVLYDKDVRLWLIKKDGAKRTIASFITKEEALNRVKDLSASKDLSYVVHKKNGKFQKK